MTTTLISNSTFEATIAAPGVVSIRILAEPLGVLTVAARRDLTSFLQNLASKYGARCAVLIGRGKGFSVGSNIKEFEATAEWIDSARITETKLAETIERGPVPVIAACNGHTLGGGLVMALACDFRIAGRSATFGFPEVKLGAMATSSGTQRLPLLVGRGHALRIMLTGQSIGAEEAYRIGLVQHPLNRLNK